jgi:hypothetical protein
MARESAIFTALPNGVRKSGKFLHVTIFVTPRLSAEDTGTLLLTGGDFPAFADWPATLVDTAFSIVFEGAATLPAKPDLGSSAPDSGTWHLLFDDCGVGEGGFTDLSKRRFLSFPVKTATASVLDLYTELAEGFPTAFPPVTSGPLSDFAKRIGPLGRVKHRYYGLLDDLIEQEHGPGDKTGRYLNRGLISPTQRERMAFVEAYRFYDRPGSRDPLGPTKAPPPPKVPPLEFHGFVTFCGDYPKLLRPLGLAVDVLVEKDAAIKPSGRIRVQVDEAPFDWMKVEGARPWTRYEIAQRRFLPRPRSKEGDLVDGTLRLEWERYFLVNQLDVDGSVLKAGDLVDNVIRVADHLSENAQSMTEDASSASALRTGGFTIARDGRAARVVDVLDTAADHDAAQTGDAPADLAAEEVTRGYRLDVEDSTHPGRWLSLHRRVGTYVVRQDGGEVPLPVGEDEAYVKGASGSSVPEQEDDLYLHETMFGWDGWSLAAKRPGRAITNEGVADVEPENPTAVPLFTSFDAKPGSLPRLRFGRDYRFRARAVDLAGNSVRDDDVVPQHVTKQHRFRRFDPVPAPAVVPRRAFTEGESLLRMVIRSTLGVLPNAYVALPRITGLTGHTDPQLAYLATNDRHIAPPVSAQQLAEWHGKFDDGIGVDASQADVDDEFDVAALESGSFVEAPGAVVFNPDPSATPTDLSDPNREKGDPLAPGEYVLHDVARLALPYLPDPLSLGASLTTLPGDPATRLQRWEAGAEWYERRPFRLRIQNGSGAPSYNASQRLLTVLLPQAEMVTVRLSSFLDSADLDLMAVWMLERDVVRAAQQQLAEQGLHWMLTPSQPLTLVHAVEKPLEPPVIDVPPGGVQRYVGETFAVLAGKIKNHAKSTGRLDVEARWTEPIDDLADDAPSTLDGQAHVGDFQLEATEADCRTGRNDVASPPTHKLRHEFGDTKHRRVSYHAVATTRFREYFPPVITSDPSLITRAGAEVELNVPSSRRPDPPEVLYVVPTWTWDERMVRPVARAGARRPPATFTRTRSGGGLRVYLDRPWYSSGADELLGVVLEDQPWITWPFDVAGGLTVNATAKALADELAERAIAEGIVKPVGPAAASPSQRVLAAIQRKRAAAPRAVANPTAAHEAAESVAMDAEAGPAVKLTGPQIALLDSILALVFTPSGDPQKYVTQWGVDPIWRSAPVAAGPHIHQFPLRVAVGTGISLLEAPGHQVTVVGHEPKFDSARRLWYCDLQLDAGSSYFPFVRLALARYQPYSIPGQHLSRVVFPDVAQLVARRTAALTRLSRTGVLVSLRGPAGYTDNAQDLSWIFARDEQLLSLSRFAIAQVERRPADATTDLAWAAVGDEVRLELLAPGGLGDVRYSGRVPLPARDAKAELRLALREYEIFETDESEAEDHLVRRGPFGDFPTLSRPVRYRLVYADYLAL